MRGRIPALKIKLSKSTADTEKNIFKKDLGLEYYKLSPFGAESKCRIAIVKKSDTEDLCKNAFHYMEDLKLKDHQIISILLKEHDSYFQYLNEDLNSKLDKYYVPQFFQHSIKTLYSWYNKEYDPLFLFKKVPEDFFQNNQEYSYIAASITSDIQEKKKYLDFAKNHNPSIFARAILHKKDKEHFEALSLFNRSKDYLPSLYSSLVLKHSAHDIISHIDSLYDEKGGLKAFEDQNSLYVALFSFFESNSEVGKKDLAQILKSIKVDANTLPQIKSLVSLLPIISKKPMDSGKIEVLDNEMKNLDGYALGILGYLAYNGKIIDQKSLPLLNELKDKLNKVKNSSDKSTPQGTQEIKEAKKQLEVLAKEGEIALSKKFLLASIDKGFTKSNLFLGKIYNQLKDFKNAYIHLEKSKEDSIDAPYILGSMVFQEGEYEKAKAYFSTFSYIDPLSRYSECLLYTKDYKGNKDIPKALTCLKDLLGKSEPLDAHVHYAISALSLKQSDIDSSQVNNHIELAQKAGIDTSYIKVAIKLMQKQCSGLKEIFDQNLEDPYFLYLQAADRIQGQCLTQDTKKAKELAKSILSKEIQDIELSLCLDDIFTHATVSEDCLYHFDHLNFEYSELQRIQPKLSDLFADPQLLNSLPLDL